MTGARRTVAMVAAAFGAGFLVASVSAFGYAKYPVWRDFGEAWQLGYVVGFLDANTLARYRDPRGASIPAGGKPPYERWRDEVNAFFSDPKNESLEVVDGMSAVAAKMVLERMNVIRERKARRLAPSPSPH